MENNDKKFRALAIAAICIAIVGISIAYAALGAVLNVTGTATVSTANSWNVAATQGSCTKTAGSPSVTKNLTTVGQTATWSASFVAPGDQITCTFDWTNSGSIDAAVTNLVVNASGDAKDYFTYNVTMGTTALSAVVPKNKYLKAGSTKTVTMVVTFDENSNLTSQQLADLDTKSATFTAAFEFAQADSSVTYTDL